MIAQTPARAPALYAVIDRRHDGRPRIVSEHLDPQSARAAADLLRFAGDAVEVVLLSTIRDYDGPANVGGQDGQA